MVGIRLNEDRNVVNRIREGLKKSGGYCPCSVSQTEDTKCICKDFKDKLHDPEFEGYCHCTLYYKYKEDDEIPLGPCGEVCNDI